MSLKEKILKEKLPRHVAIIMDGNGRWAKKRGNLRVFGHKNAINSVRNAVEAAAELGIEYLTLYAFSTENWNRPRQEIDALMSLLVVTINKEMKTLLENNVKLHCIGCKESLPSNVAKKLNLAIKSTSNHTGLNLVLALSYSSRWEIVEAVKKIVKDVKSGTINVNDINSDNFANYLSTTGIPDPELMIRTSGEYRISNFLLWQIAYSELYFTKTLWPDFSKEDFYEALLSFQGRERRYGKTSEQIKENVNAN